MTLSTSRQGGFTFIEILVVMSIIVVLAGLVVTVVPTVIEEGRKTESLDNVRTLSLWMINRSIKRKWAAIPYSGKSFTLSVVVTGDLVPKKENLGVLFSPGDEMLTIDTVDLDRYKQLTKDSLRSGGHEDLTSYAGRRNERGSGHIITSAQAQDGTMILADDDYGPLHHKGGIVTGWTNSRVMFMEWADLHMPTPDDPDHPEPFLGDMATHDELAKLSSD